MTLIADNDPHETALTIVNEGDPEQQLAILEQRAALAKRHAEAMNTILVSQTFPEDWTVQGEGDKAKACLGSAGAERIGRQFPIQHEGVTYEKQTGKDDAGDYYIYTYTGTVTMGTRSMHVQGSYGTRDKFLGFTKSVGWKNQSEINENNIRNAAYHVFCGNAVKAMLGIRNIPLAQYEAMMQRAGHNTATTQTVTRGQGSQGGTSTGDHAHQVELGNIIMSLVNSGYTVEEDNTGSWIPVRMSESDDRDPKEIAKSICMALSSFRDKKTGKTVPGKGPHDLKEKWLLATLDKARKVKAFFDQSAPAVEAPQDEQDMLV